MNQDEVLAELRFQHDEAERRYHEYEAHGIDNYPKGEWRYWAGRKLAFKIAIALVEQLET